MHTDDTLLRMPPLPNREDGQPRRIGIELELIGLDIDTLSRIAAEHLGGRVEKKSRYEHGITGHPLGEWAIELDFDFLKQRGRNARDDDDLFADLDAAAEDLLRAGAEQIVPLEIVSPPLPMARMELMEGLIERLRHAGAQGTRAGLTYAFGLQFNPELPGIDAVTIARYLKAFLCLFDWLKEKAEVDLTRRLTFYTDPFPADYVRKVIDPDYRPDLPGLIDDYLADNPTRNRALDLLPLFAHLDDSRVRAAVDDPRVKARPTLHYRLPNSEIDRSDWGLYRAWNDWLQVEHLVAEPARLDRLCAEYRRFLDRPFSGLRGGWKEQLTPWLKARQDL